MPHPCLSINIPEPESHRASIAVLAGCFPVHELNAFVFVGDLPVGVPGEEGNDAIFITEIENSLTFRLR